LQKNRISLSVEISEMYSRERRLNMEEEEEVSVFLQRVHSYPSSNKLLQGFSSLH